MSNNNPYISNSELTAFRRNRAFLNGDINELLYVFNILIDESLEQKSYSRALFNLWSALSICEYATDQQQVEKTLSHTLNFSPFLHQIEDYTILIESIVTRFLNSSNEITSTSYFILSLLCINQKQLERSYNYAKMAYFYATRLDEENNQPYLCNAQLQLIFSKLLSEHFVHVDSYLNQFGWHIENCKNDQERILIQTIYLLKGTLFGTVKEADLLLFAEKLATSSKYFYPLYLLMQMKHVVHKTNNHSALHKVDKFYKVFYNRTMQTSQQALNDYYLLRNRFITNSNLFFTKAEQLFDEIKNSNSTACLYHITNVQLQLPSLYEFTLHNTCINFLLYPLHQQEFLLLFNSNQNKQINNALAHYMTDHEILLSLQSNAQHSRFIELYIDYTQQINH